MPCDCLIDWLTEWLRARYDRLSVCSHADNASKLMTAGSYIFTTGIAQIETPLLRLTRDQISYDMSQGSTPCETARAGWWVKSRFRHLYRKMARKRWEVRLELLSATRKHTRAFDWYHFQWPWMIVNDRNTPHHRVYRISSGARWRQTRTNRNTNSRSHFGDRPTCRE